MPRTKQAAKKTRDHLVGVPGASASPATAVTRGKVPQLLNQSTLVRGYPPTTSRDTSTHKNKQKEVTSSVTSRTSSNSRAPRTTVRPRESQILSDSYNVAAPSIFSLSSASEHSDRFSLTVVGFIS